MHVHSSPRKRGYYRQAETSDQGSSRALSPCSPHCLLPPGLIDTCKECGARALELVGQLQDQQALLQAQPSRVRPPLQGILQLGQVRCAARTASVDQGLEGAVGPGWGLGPQLCIFFQFGLNRCSCAEPALPGPVSQALWSCIHPV